MLFTHLSFAVVALVVGACSLIARCAWCAMRVFAPLPCPDVSCTILIGGWWERRRAHRIVADTLLRLLGAVDGLEPARLRVLVQPALDGGKARGSSSVVRDATGRPQTVVRVAWTVGGRRVTPDALVSTLVDLYVAALAANAVTVAPPATSVPTTMVPPDVTPGRDAAPAGDAVPFPPDPLIFPHRSNNGR